MLPFCLQLMPLTALCLPRMANIPYWFIHSTFCRHGTLSFTAFLIRPLPLRGAFCAIISAATRTLDVEREDGSLKLMVAFGSKLSAPMAFKTVDYLSLGGAPYILGKAGGLWTGGERFCTRTAHACPMPPPHLDSVKALRVYFRLHTCATLLTLSHLLPVLKHHGA